VTAESHQHDMRNNPPCKRLDDLLSRSRAKWGICVALTLGFLSTSVHGQERDLSHLTFDERQSIESVCATAKYYTIGPVAYNKCIADELNTLTGVHRPDLTGVGFDEKQSIESVCATAKFTIGPAAYDKCLADQLSTLKGSLRPDLSRLSFDERQSAESVCATEKFTVGPAAYDKCLAGQLSTLKGSQRPDLSGLSFDERQSIESVCATEKFTVGPAAYDLCLRRQVSQLQNASDTGSASKRSSSAGRNDWNVKASAESGVAPRQESNEAEKRLLYFAGIWTITGQVNVGPFGPAGKLSGTHRNEWDSARHSLTSHWEEQRPSGADSGDATYRYDPDQHTYLYHAVAGSGEIEDSTGSVNGDTWTWTSAFTTEEGEAMNSRFIIKETSPTSYDFTYELLAQDGQWATVFGGAAVKSK